MGTLTINNAACNVVQYPVSYGVLYNWHAATDARKISSSDDWIIPTKTIIDTLDLYLSDDGGAMKETGNTYWLPPNSGATNSTGFNGRGCGARSYIDGVFAALNTSCNFWSSSQSSTVRYVFTLNYNFSNIATGYNYVVSGVALRLVYAGGGTPSSYTGNDGKTYRIVTIGTQTWLADNLSETRFRDGSIIPWFGANPANYFTNAEWIALTTAGCCAYENTLSNVAPGFSFPT